LLRSIDKISVSLVWKFWTIFWVINGFIILNRIISTIKIRTISL